MPYSIGDNAAKALGEHEHNKKFGLKGARKQRQFTKR
jgi:ribosomal protein S9